MSSLEERLAQARRSGDSDALVAAYRELARASAAPGRRHRSGVELVTIAAGPTRLGEEGRAATLGRFELARLPLTNRLFAAFLDATGYRPAATDPEPERFLAHWPGGPEAGPPEELLDHPVVFVSWLDAAAWCRWAGLVLPTEWMWEKAARGPEGRVYPWGNTAPRSHLAWVQRSTTGAVPTQPASGSPYGVYDLIGNVSEWCRPTGGGAEHRLGDRVEPTRGTGYRTMPVRGSAFMRVTAHKGRMTGWYRRVLTASRRNHWTGFRPAAVPEERA